jgi:hypothetical protein
MATRLSASNRGDFYRPRLERPEREEALALLGTA